MARRLSIGLNVVLAAALVWTVLSPTPASGGKVRYWNFNAPSFVDREYSEHNDGNNTIPDACDAEIAKTDLKGGENFGDLDNGEGSYLANVRLPDGATLRELKLFTFDASAEDAHVFLVRKRIVDELDPRLAGYKVLAEISSRESASTEMQSASDKTILHPAIQNENFTYFLELVLCDVIEPFAVQLEYEEAS